MGKRVSIPYRLATNYEIERIVRGGIESFNPLQVSYKPSPDILPIKFDLRFNPLQVSYKQTCVENIKEVIIQFQSLIGQLQTPGNKRGYVFEIYVSIPYRLATNVTSIFIQKISSECFNPLQVSYKLGRRIVRFRQSIAFQSLIGQLQTT